MWPRKRFDIRMTDIAAGIFYCLKPFPAAQAREQLEKFWAPDGDGLAFLSVRSGFDALWEALKLPEGSEVLITAVNIPHMAEIIRFHRLVPVPVDLDLERMAPLEDLLPKLRSEKTRAVVVAHLFGGQVRMEPILRWAKENGLLVIEDCAQAYSGLHYRGHPEADVSMFSFGSIKTATALGGALFRIRNPQLAARMRAVEQSWPVQSRLKYLQRLLKYAWFSVVCRPVPFALFVSTCRLMGYDYDHIIHSAVRGFPGNDWRQKIRHQPCGPLMLLLLRRLKRYDMGRLAQRAAKGEMLLELLSPHVFCPGAKAENRTHWVFPILVDDPVGVTARLQRAGFDAARTHSLAVIDAPPDHPLAPPLGESRRLLQQLVCLPIYPEIPDRAIRQMANVVLEPYHPSPVFIPKTHPVG